MAAAGEAGEASEAPLEEAKWADAEQALQEDDGAWSSVLVKWIGTP